MPEDGDRNPLSLNYLSTLTDHGAECSLQLLSPKAGLNEFSVVEPLRVKSRMFADGGRDLETIRLS
jgi:hypothetical protein